MVRYIKQEFNIRDEETNEFIFDQSILNADTYFLRCILYTNTERDLPNLLASSEKYIETVRHIYDSIKKDNRRYRLVLEQSPTTTICELFNVYVKTNGVIKITILCKTPLEEYIAKKICNVGISIISGDYTTDISRYDIIYVNHYIDVLKYIENTKLEGKEIIMPDYYYNLDVSEPRRPPLLGVSILVSRFNKIKTVCPYKNFTLPADEED